MPIHPDSHMWQILLSICNIHGNIVLGNVAARKLFELQPENKSVYLLQSNPYAIMQIREKVDMKINLSIGVTTEVATAQN